MLEIQERYVLQKFPLLIDPSASSLEVQVSLRPVNPDGVTGPSVRPAAWTQLGRVRLRHDTLPFSLSTRNVHFFGLSSDPHDCPFMLVYDATGVLRLRVDRLASGEFIPFELPAEVSGLAVTRPSVRLTFDDPADAQAFLDLVRGSKVSPPDPDWAEALALLASRCREVAHTHVASRS